MTSLNLRRLQVSLPATTPTKVPDLTDLVFDGYKLVYLDPAKSRLMSLLSETRIVTTSVDALFFMMRYNQSNSNSDSQSPTEIKSNGEYGSRGHFRIWIWTVMSSFFS
ncbi:hypothetical protein HanRHA438_Chr17g0814341 [Helianthus annuus]|nr:hypothetical protein HanIR_Chr17g0872481 [Helianthus annuus]KAJ0447645.1 hypothetical protein HanHA89_Chr17g0707671 [Helianthus annuus]KAJ0632548.1 hypothetical protein HanLR1_Chr17g0666321 [Helianthus annuus]KAJ0826441.1 hypothetical protein HanRHA438_Chr17g0814341 [Helianthus annuus]